MRRLLESIWSVATGLVTGFLVLWVIFSADGVMKKIRSQRICESKGYTVGTWNPNTFDVICDGHIVFPE